MLYLNAFLSEDVRKYLNTSEAESSIPQHPNDEFLKATEFLNGER